MEGGEDKRGWWVQGRYVYLDGIGERKSNTVSTLGSGGMERGPDVELLRQWEAEMQAVNAEAEAQGLVEIGEAEGAVGSTSDHLGFDFEETLWYLRRLHYSMYFHSLAAPPGTWCSGRSEIQELVSEAYGVDVHLHSFVPQPPANRSRGAGPAQDAAVEMQWEWQTDSLYPRATLPTGERRMVPERPTAALHLCLCGNHMWAAPVDSDVWYANNFNLSEANYTALSDAEYEALPQEEKDAVVHWDRHNDPVVKMFFEDELPRTSMPAGTTPSPLTATTSLRRRPCKICSLTRTPIGSTCGTKRTRPACSGEITIP